MIAIKGMTISKDSEGCLSCAFHWNGDSTTYCLAQSHPYRPAGQRLHKINYDDPDNPYGGKEGMTEEESYKACITWKESTCPLIELVNKSQDLVKDLVEEMPSYSEIPNKWIPVSERLPEADGRYLCTYEDDIEENCVDFGSYKNGEWYVDKVIAWMPLPKPFEPQESEGIKIRNEYQT